MRRHFIWLAALGLSAACGPAAPGQEGGLAPAEAVRACGAVSGAGYCGVRFGFAPQAAKAAFKEKLVSFSGEAASEPDVCFELYASGALEGISFMVEGGRVGRVDIAMPGPATREGFGVGSAEADIRTRLGARLEEAPDKYEPAVVELSYGDRDGKVTFEVESGTVRTLRAGITPMIDYVERCG